MTEDELQELIRAAAARYGDPPDPPLDRMWAQVEARVFQPGVIPLRPHRPWRQPLAYAAVLVVGVGVGFFVGRARPGAPHPSTPEFTGMPGSEVAVSPAVASPFVGVASDYLEQATGLLIAVAGELRTSGAVPAGTVSRARDVLSTTRLLLDTAPTDPALHTLLEDLELVLAQVVRLPASRSAPDAALIRETLDQRDVLPRLTVMLADARAVP